MHGSPVAASSIKLRPVAAGDVAAITQIYAHAVLTGTASFEIEPPDEAEMSTRMAKIAARGLPWLVAVDGNGQVVGFAYAGPFKERAAYAATVENSVYVTPDAESVRCWQ
jgi:L-amino acid N-acyltransferase YncA